MLALGPEIQVWKAKGIPSPVRKFISLAGTNVNSGRNLSWEGAGRSKEFRSCGLVLQLLLLHSNTSVSKWPQNMVAVLRMEHLRERSKHLGK